MRGLRTSVLLVGLGMLAGFSTLAAQVPADAAPVLTRLAWSTDSTEPRRFVAVHGRRSALFGYSQEGLEVWASALQILTGYRVSFRQQGASTEVDGQVALRRIVYSPEAITRIYAGPDFIVREKLFVALDVPGAIISYETAGTRPVDIAIHFVPELDLMWPASIGGQQAVWTSAASAYLLSEPTGRFTARVGSPDIVAHDDTANPTLAAGRSPGLGFVIRVDHAHSAARVIIAAGRSESECASIARQLLNEGTSLEQAALDHYAGLLDHALQIETPDFDVNRALSWSEIALDQAWACNPDLGCAEVAGFGPSRNARRPQYDWFFAGDGMVAVHALLASGQYEQARQELEFILKFQDRKTGMIWHELSQSAGSMDWMKLPYMYIHVDASFDLLDTVAEYVSTTGDLAFAKDHWESLQAAYHYCRSVLDPKSGLPRIPPDKEGGNEQDAISDDLALSASWISASEFFASLAAAVGHHDVADMARRTGQRARGAIAQRYWSESQHFWISGYTRSGAPMINRDIRPTRVLRMGLFSSQQRQSLLDQLASSDFQTDWGTRSKAASDPTYDPNLYASGSVWALGTAAVATAFWAEHRPATALPIWQALVPWTSLDSLGHMHEVLAGDYYMKRWSRCLNRPGRPPRCLRRLSKGCWD